MEKETQLDLLAELSALDIEEDEREKLAEDIGGILDYVRQLQDLDIPMGEFKRGPVLGDYVRDDVVDAAGEGERKSVIENFPVKSKDGLMQAHAALKHK